MATIAVDNSTMGLSIYATVFKGFEGDIDLRGTGVNDDDCFANTFDECGQVDSNMEIRNTNFLNTVAVAADAAFLWNDTDANIADCLFVNNLSAVEHDDDTSTPYSYNGMIFSGNTNDVNNTSGSAITVNKNNGSDPTSYTGSAVTFLGSTVTFKVVTATADGTGVNGVQVFVKASDGTGTLPFEDVVTGIVNTGTLAVVAHTDHELDSGDKVLIRGASHEANNGVFTVTVNDSAEYEYTMGSSPGSSPTGTILATFVALYGLTANDGTDDGVIEMDRIFDTDQPIIGNGRKYADIYKTAPIVGTVDIADGLTVTAILVPES